MITLTFADFTERYSAHLQAVFFFTASDTATPRIPVGERVAILFTAWNAAVDAIADRLRAWTDREAPLDKVNATVRHLHLLPDIEKRLPQGRIDACLMALVHDTCHPDQSPRGRDLLTDLTADLL